MCIKNVSKLCLNSDWSDMKQQLLNRKTTLIQFDLKTKVTNYF